MKRPSSIITGLVLASSSAAALELNVNDTASIKLAASTIAKGLYVHHNSSSTAGDFNQPQPWFWWLSGNAWNGLLDYTVYTGDTTYQADLLTALGENVGPDYNFFAPAQMLWEANDDQLYWVFNALTAMEYDLEPLPCAAAPGGGCANSWANISANAFDLLAGRWRSWTGTCGGGLKWQWNSALDGYHYKNAVTNGGFFQLAARLARHTGNRTYAGWAADAWDWSARVGLVAADHRVLDGTWDGGGANCSVVSADQWSYNAASYMHGAAHMYAAAAGGPDEAAWEARVQGLVAAAGGAFFGPFANASGVMYERGCELAAACGTDQTSFKSSLARWMGKTAVLVPSVGAGILGLLRASAGAAASACDGYGNSTCGMKWYTGGFDGTSDFGVQLSALEIVQSLLVTGAPELAVASASAS